MTTIYYNITNIKYFVTNYFSYHTAGINTICDTVIIGILLLTLIVWWI